MNEWIPVSISPDATERVRAGVFRRIRRRKAARRVSAAAAGVAVLALFLWPSPPEMETLSLAMPRPRPAPVWKSRPAPAAPSKITARVLSRPADRITIYTDDPDVVIVLVADGGEE